MPRRLLLISVISAATLFGMQAIASTCPQLTKVEKLLTSAKKNPAFCSSQVYYQSVLLNALKYNNYTLGPASPGGSITCPNNQDQSELAKDFADLTDICGTAMHANQAMQVATTAQKKANKADGGLNNLIHHILGTKRVSSSHSDVTTDAASDNVNMQMQELQKREQQEAQQEREQQQEQQQQNNNTVSNPLFH